MKDSQPEVVIVEGREILVKTAGGGPGLSSEHRGVVDRFRVGNQPIEINALRDEHPPQGAWAERLNPRGDDVSLRIA